jgi:glycolate oxidase iron-sulfur subunit
MNSPVAEPARTELPTVPLAAAAAPTPCPAGNPGHGIDYGLFLDCIHCGLCLAACPTYEELGTEMDGPRGRIYLMRAVTDGRLAPDAAVRKHLDLCLDCRACETACPSGVQYHKMLEPFRAALEHTHPPDTDLPWLQRQILRHVFPYARRTRLALAPVRLMQRLGLDRLVKKSGVLKLLPAWMRRMDEMLPALRPHYGSLPEVLPAEGKRRARVGFLLGCVADGVFPETNLATIRVLHKNGCEVWLPRNQGCCGALPFHDGREAEARQFAVANCRAFGFADGGESLDAVITNAAGCGAMLKEYDLLLKDTPHAEVGAKFRAKVRDVSEFLVELGPVRPTHPLPIKATYHDACHLRHAQHVYEQPRRLLGLIPELELVPLVETDLCCGAAGSYNLTQPEMAERLGERKARRILETGARAVFTGNVGCLMQITKHLHRQRPDFWVAHPIDALWASYSGEKPK